jgi:hypothetical protein
MDTAIPSPAVSALASTLTQLAPRVHRILESLRFLVDQPVIREPYYLGTSNPGGNVIAAGATNIPLPQADYSHSMEWPFEVRRVRLSNDPQHTYRDWSFTIMDLTATHTWMKNPQLADGMIDANTGFWELPYPWVIRPAGGGWQINVNNLDPNNPITVNFVLHGNLLIPR